MLLIQKIDALLSGVTRQDVEHLKPAQRQRLAFVLRAIADLADPPRTVGEKPKAGILAEIRNGAPRHE